MALAALIGAYREVDGGDALCATLPVAGQVLVEHQARQAAQAGAGTVILLVERVPAPLTAAVDRLRRSGLSIEVARSVADAADRVHPDERLLVIADGLLADQRLLDRLSASGGPAVLALPDAPPTARFERIDAQARWGGLLVTDGARLRRTAAMLGEWDLLSTLLRSTLQDGAQRVEAPGGVFLINRPDDIEPARGSLIEATRQHARSWPERYLFAPAEELLVPHLLRAGADATWVRGAAIALTLVAALAFAKGWSWAGLLATMLSLPVDAVGRRLARLRMDSAAKLTVGDRARAGGRVAALAGFAYATARIAGWGVWTLDAGLVAALLALACERLLLVARGSAVRVPAWLANEEAAALVLLLCAAAGHPLAGLVLANVYTVCSLLFLQWRQLAGNRAAGPV